MPQCFYCIQVNRSPKGATERLLQDKNLVQKSFFDQNENLRAKKTVSSRFVPMVFSYPDDSYPGLDCNKWQQRTCKNGVSRETYRDAVKSGVDIPWKCESCSASRAILPNFQSTRNEGKKNFKASKIVKLKTFLFKN